MPKRAILCVDDETLVLENLEIELQKAFGDAYDYEFAESAEEALEVIDELGEDDVEILIIVSDWLMPGMKGDEFLIQVHQKLPTIIKIMLTGQADEEAIERAQDQANLHRCLSKPWDSKELIDTIRASLASL
ncbi:MAG TPA: response regulator [Thioploca sp.]|nr:MAG: response regulator [Gammaproteobacteria bacterium]HDN26483.1 response regulator [Thioploca sp.]